LQLKFSIVLKKIINVFSCGVWRQCMNCSNLEPIPEWCRTCRHHRGAGHGVLGVGVGTC
jgi:hypothetical protein